MIIFHILVLSTAVLQAQCFTLQAVRSNKIGHFSEHPSRLSSSRSNKDSGSGGDGAEALDAMRNLLKMSWDADTMGRVPSDPIAAANEAFAGISSASENGINICFVDLLLPSYDITLGTNMYDEVIAVEYCIALSSCLKGRTSILVRDARTVKTVGRILDAREKYKLGAKDEEEDDEDDYDDEEEEKDDEEAFIDDEGEEDEYDDDIGSVGEGPPSVPPSATDVNAFRQQLISGWNGDSNNNFLDGKIKDQPSIGKTPEARQTERQETKKENRPPPRKRYRLASFFGDGVITSGANMVQDIIRAIQENALPTEEEESIIILSPISREEVVAVRSLVANYAATKKIVLVNSKIDPLPRELLAGVTVYSVLPLLAQPTGLKPGESDNPNPNVVVLRRYPRDWEIFVDIGKGFELAATKVDSPETIAGPDKEWIASCVQQHLKFKNYK
jgi:Domain of unknown function (DUF1995)